MVPPLGGIRNRLIMNFVSLNGRLLSIIFYIKTIKKFKNLLFVVF